VTGVPLNLLIEKEQDNVKLVFIGNYIYADHQYKSIPEFQHFPKRERNRTGLQRTLTNLMRSQSPSYLAKT